MKGKAITLYCRPCNTGYASVGETPSLCPKCGQVPYWSTAKPLKFTKEDEDFLRTQRIRPE